MIIFYLIGGTQQELLDIAHERKIDPGVIALIRHPSDLYCFAGGELLIGRTVELDSNLLFAFKNIAHGQGMKVPEGAVDGEER